MFYSLVSFAVKYTYSVFKQWWRGRGKFVPYVGHMTHAVYVWLHLCVIDLKEKDDPAAVMETCTSTLSLLKTMGSCTQ